MVSLLKAGELGGELLGSLTFRMEDLNFSFFWMEVVGEVVEKGCHGRANHECFGVFRIF